MNIELENMTGTVYDNFTNFIQSKETLRGYTRDIKQFLLTIKDKDFEAYLGYAPKSRNVSDLAEAYVDLAHKNIHVAKLAVMTYLEDLTKKVERGELNPNSVPNKIKPIRALLAANDVDISWERIRKLYPLQIRGEDRAYAKNEIREMLEHCTTLVDRVIILVFISSGIRLEAWDHLCWKDLIFFTTDSKNFKGASLRVCGGDIETYWSFITPEACEAIQRYKESWRKKFFKDPRPDDPLLASVQYDIPHRLHHKGIKARVEKIVTAIGMRDKEKKKNGRFEVALDHGFRKFFNTSLRLANVNYLDKEDMMGHTPRLEKHCERYTEEDFERFPQYQKAIPYLTISNEERLKTESIQKEDLEHKNTELLQLKQQVDKLQYGADTRISRYKNAILDVNEPTMEVFIALVGSTFENLEWTEEQKRQYYKQIIKQQSIEPLKPFNKKEIDFLKMIQDALFQGNPTPEEKHKIVHAFRTGLLDIAKNPPLLEEER